MRPSVVAALFVLVLNDHVLKASPMGGWVTGKLSDVAGLFFFPVLLASWARLVTSVTLRKEWAPRKLAIASTALTGVVFVAVQLSPPVNAWISSLIGPNVMDPTDLLALPALIPAARVIWLEPCTSRPSPRVLRGAMLIAASLASVATSAQHPKDMGVPQQVLREPCASVVPVACRAQDGKVLIDVSVRRLQAVEQQSAACGAAVEGARWLADEATFVEAVSLTSASRIELSDDSARLLQLTAEMPKQGAARQVQLTIRQRGQRDGIPMETSDVLMVECDLGTAKPVLKVAE